MEPFKDREDLMSTFKNRLESIQSEKPSSFFAQGNLDNVRVGLDVEGVGSVSLPISEHDAQRLIAQSRQAPFGKGERTFVDKSVRNTWEIDASKIQLRHPSWHEQLRLTVNWLGQQLGIEQGSQVIRADLYKLLIYETGAMFKAHKDTEKAPGMFGTLALCLPSKHEGGDLVLNFHGECVTLKTDASSEWSSTCLAWFSDVLHEVTPVLSGYRIVLTFNLIQKEPTVGSDLSDHCGTKIALASSLTRWKESIAKDSSLPKFLVYLLDYQYTDASLRMDQLKGNDRHKVHVISQLMDETNCACYLASVKKEVQGPVEGPYEEYDPFEERDSEDEDEDEDRERDYGSYPIIAEAFSDTLALTRVVNLNGSLWESNIPIEDTCLVDDSYSDREPDNHEFTEYTGNEGAQATHWYHDTAVILVPQKYAMDLRIMAYDEGTIVWADDTRTQFKNIVEFVKAQQEQYEKDKKDSQNKQDLTRICQIMINANAAALQKLGSPPIQRPKWDTRIPYSAEAMGYVAIACLSLECLDLLKGSISAITPSFPLPILSKMSAQFHRFSFEQLRDCMTAVVKKCASPTDRTDAIQILFSGFHSHPPGQIDQARAWVISPEEYQTQHKRPHDSDTPTDSSKRTKATGPTVLDLT